MQRAAAGVGGLSRLSVTVWNDKGGFVFQLIRLSLQEFAELVWKFRHPERSGWMLATSELTESKDPYTDHVCFG
jgi:hypothetical protein